MAAFSTLLLGRRPPPGRLLFSKHSGEYGETEEILDFKRNFRKSFPQDIVEIIVDWVSLSFPGGKDWVIKE